MVNWDNGSSLSVAYGEDRCRKLKPVLEYDGRGEGGNIFCILGDLLRIMRHNNKGTPFEITKQRHLAIAERVFKAKSYDEALKIIGEEVELKDISKN